RRGQRCHLSPSLRPLQCAGDRRTGTKMGNLADNIAAGGKRMTVFGVIAIVLGVLAMMAPLLTGISIVFLLGGLVAVSGALRMIWAFRSGSIGRGLWMFAIGSLTLVCGAAMLANPLFGSAVM